MAIIVEDGSIVDGANSYVTEAELVAYASARGITLVGNTEQLLIIAMDYIESLDYKGIKRKEEQPLQWPRFDVVVDGYYLDIDEIPKLLKEGLMETAIATDAGNDPAQDVPRETRKEKVGPLEVEYATGSSALTIVRRINNKLYKLLKSGGTSGGSFIVDRG